MTVEFKNDELLSELEIKWISEVLTIAVEMYKKDKGETILKRADEMLEANPLMKSLKENDLNGYKKLMDELTVKRRSSLANHMALIPKILEKLQKYQQIVHK